MKILALYFSGTGNTEYALKRFLSHFKESRMLSIEENIDFAEAVSSYDTLLVAYPIYGSDMPVNMRTFLTSNRELFEGKYLITLATQYLFSGDGGMLAYRLLKKQVKGLKASVHVNMPANINLPPFISIKNGAENETKLLKACLKIDSSAEVIKDGGRVFNGRSPFAALGGYLTQRLWFRLFVEPIYRSKLKINREKCTVCGLCVSSCPVGNLSLEEGLIKTQKKCVLCYRCVNRCPQGAIALMSDKDGLNQYQSIQIDG